MISAEYTLPGIHVRDHRISVPLNWFDDRDQATITVFARELVDPVRRHEDLPCLLYLQGGPGGKSPRPVTRRSWIDHALQTFRVVLLDQRGTGRSSPVDGALIGSLDPAAAAEYLTFFRADSIVADAEHLRNEVFGGQRWSTLGQSYGGFLTLTYLSRAPEGLRACYVTGGLASVHPDAAEVYRRTYPRTAAKNREYYQRYPADVERVARVADLLTGSEVLLPDGDVLTVRRLQALGLDFGMKPGFERMHWLFDEAFTDDAMQRLSPTFLGQVWNRTSYLDNPLFAVLQESIYGTESSGATAWAAQRERANHPEFGEDGRPLLFTGEMMYPWMFEEIRALRPFRAAVDVLAGRETWTRLYDLERLAANEVPVAAAVYFDDMYVDSGLQLQTADAVGNLRAWVTNEYEHDGLDGDRVLPHLMRLIDDFGGPRPR
ncbi:alpha/beta fold hydrolase [Saccharopolyspora sp. 5N708]|uniref:alpha/beta fold hydrolase n=1 Tax=Saccharopolyspora sp. 5N708 TaxID=3457424 RepID=UPI003FD44844